MISKKFTPEQSGIAKQLLHWTLLIVPVSVSTGLLVALFLWLLDLATTTRQQYLWLIFLLPLAGILITWLYSRWGKNSEAGNNLIMEELHQPGEGVPARLTPLILFTTVLTHLTGGSAGREGTAVQMGGSVSALFNRWYRLERQQRRILLMCGMAAGFGAVFGTPIAGAVFAMEVLAIGRIKYDALVPCLIASILADLTCTLTGIQHTHYMVSFIADHKYELPGLLMLAKVVAAGMLFGITGFLFAELTHLIKNKSKQFIRNQYLIPVIGAGLVLLISFCIGSFDYLGLGVTSASPDGVSIVSSFLPGGANALSWFWKLLLTAITLGMGFKGGEVTPLFFIGATLGNTLATASGAPVDLFAAMGFIAVFAAASNTPIASTLMGAELFGTNNIFYFAIACFTAYYFSGHTGIYHSQRLAVSKFHNSFRIERSLQQIRQKRKERQKH